MNKLFKILSLFVCFTLLFGIFACGKSDDTADGGDSGGDSQTGILPDGKIEGLDFILEFPAGKDITILQISDTQAMLYSGIREERKAPVHYVFFRSGVYDTYTRVWQYVEEGIRRAEPDLIVLTGDNIYGETDDSGELWQEMIDFLDSFEIPWLCIFGNHDNESEKGVLWQIAQVESSDYGIIKRGSCEHGNSNYTVGIRQGNKITRVLYMLDSNGCLVKSGGEGMLPTNVDIEHITPGIGVYYDQRDWMVSCHEKITAVVGEVPALLFMHAPINEYFLSVATKYPGRYGTFPFYPDSIEDIGFAREPHSGVNDAGLLFQTAKSVGVNGIFVGHHHGIATSVMWKDVRLTYGLKTGTGDYHYADMLGTTKIKLREGTDAFNVQYLHTQIPYPL